MILTNTMMVFILMMFVGVAAVLLLISVAAWKGWK